MQAIKMKVSGGAARGGSIFFAIGVAADDCPHGNCPKAMSDPQSFFCAVWQIADDGISATFCPHYAGNTDDFVSCK